MAQDQDETLEGPNLTEGVLLADITDGGMLLGHVNGEAALLARQGTDVFAVSAFCTHYHGQLTDGIVVGDTVRCPLHHACFSLRTGEALKAPAFLPLTCWKVAHVGDRVMVTERQPSSISWSESTNRPTSVVLIGGGAAGAAAADMLRRQGYAGPVTLLGAEDVLPSDRPNLSKDYLAGTAPEEWVPLFPPEFYEERQITLRLGVPVTQLDAMGKTVTLKNGEILPFGAALLATGADPIRLSVPGADLPHVHYLRSLADSRRIIAALASARRAVIIGASFIGLEAAASLRHRGTEVDVVAPEARPFEKVFGPEVGDFVLGLHEAKGVHFHLGNSVTEITKEGVLLKSGTLLSADIVLVGVGVRPNVALAESARLMVDRGVIVNEYLETSVPGVYAAGDIARYPDARSGKNVRIEHWVVAQRQGQTAARNMLGQRVKYSDPAFFWSQHYDVQLSYTGHSENWSRYEIDGNLKEQDYQITYFEDDHAVSVLTVARDQDNLRTEVEWEQIPYRSDRDRGLI